MFQSIIFGLMVVIAVGAGIFTCIYEAGGSSHSSVEKTSQTKPNNTQNK